MMFIFLFCIMIAFIIITPIVALFGRKEDEAEAYAALALVMTIALIICTWHMSKFNSQMEAVKVGVGEYVPDKEGDAVFQYKVIKAEK